MKNKKFAEMMKEKGLSARRLAEKIGVSDVSVGHWLSGRNLPSVLQLFKLSKVFDKTVDELYWMFKKNKDANSLLLHNPTRGRDIPRKT